MNNINPGAQGLVPVAILTTEAGEYGLPLAVDATMVDVAGLRFGTESTLNAGSGGSEPHGKGVIKDDKELDEKTKDGDLDIKLHFEIPGSGIEASTTEACVAGVYTDGDGTIRQFFGCDFVSTVPPADGGPPAPAASSAGGNGNRRAPRPIPGRPFCGRLNLGLKFFKPGVWGDCPCAALVL